MKKITTTPTAGAGIQLKNPQACAKCLERVYGKTQPGVTGVILESRGLTAMKPGPRESMGSLPRWLQPLLTALTGKALPGQEPWFRWTPAGRMVFTLVSFLAAVTLGAWAAHTGGPAWLLLPLAWLLVVSNTRIIQTGIVHHASHGTLLLVKHWNKLRNKFWNDLLGEFFSLLIWIQPLELYRRDHGPHHNNTAKKAKKANKMNSETAETKEKPGDPDLKFIEEAGSLQPGMTVPEYWRQFWRTLFSPRFHAAYLRARLQANFAEAGTSRRVAALVWAGVLAGIAVNGFGVELFLAYLLPITVLTQMSAWAGLLGLHQWVRQGEGERPAKEVIAGLTSGRFIGEAAPAPTLTGFDAAGAWTAFATRMLFIHLPARVAIVPGDLPSHDWHHFKPTGDWANAAYARRDDLVSNPDNARLYTEMWGVKTAINATFERLSQLPPDAELGDSLTYRERQSVLLSM